MYEMKETCLNGNLTYLDPWRSGKRQTWFAIGWESGQKSQSQKDEGSEWGEIKVIRSHSQISQVRFYQIQFLISEQDALVDVAGCSAPFSQPNQKSLGKRVVNVFLVNESSIAQYLLPKTIKNSFYILLPSLFNHSNKAKIKYAFELEVCGEAHCKR